MITFIKRTALIAAAVLMFFTAGCGTENDAGTDTETMQNGQSTNGDPVETEYPAPEITDFDGYEYRIYAYEEGYGYLGNFAVEEDTGDTVVSAIYNRNLKVEDEYNIKISVTVKTDVMNQMKKCAASGDDFADLTNYCIRWQFENNLIDCAANLLDIPTLNLNAPWWDQDFNSEFNINGILQSSVGDIIGTDEICTTAYLYNKAIFEAIGHNSDELYRSVNDGEWTIERSSVIATKPPPI